MGYYHVNLMIHLQDDLRDAFAKSSALICEQVAAIRTVASLRREDALLAEFSNGLHAPVRKAMMATIRSTLVLVFLKFLI